MLDELAIGDLSVAGRLAEAWYALPEDARHSLWLLAQAGHGTVPGGLVAAVTAGSARTMRALTDSCLLVQDATSGSYQFAPLIASFAVAQPAPRPNAASVLEAAPSDHGPNGQLPMSGQETPGRSPAATTWIDFAAFEHSVAAAGEAGFLLSAALAATCALTPR